MMVSLVPRIWKVGRVPYCTIPLQANGTVRCQPERENLSHMPESVKGSVSQQVRPMLLYVVRKLSL